MSIWNLPVHQERTTPTTGAAGAGRYGLTLTDDQRSAEAECSVCTSTLSREEYSAGSKCSFCVAHTCSRCDHDLTAEGECRPCMRAATEAEHALAVEKILAGFKATIPDLLTERPGSYVQLRALHESDAVALRNCLRGAGIPAHVGVLRETLTWVHVWVPKSKERTAELVAIGFSAGACARGGK